MQHMVTTIDNPYNPFTQFDEWYAYDQMKGYNTPSFLARVVRNSDELSDADYDAAVESAIQEIVDENVLGLYKKVSSSDSVSNPLT